MKREYFVKVVEDSLPQEFRSRIRNVAVLVEDMPPNQGTNVSALFAPERTRLVTSFDLHGQRMRVTSTDSGGVVSGETILEFEQMSDVVSARYRGGTIIDGYLVGNLDPTRTSLRFCYVQVDLRGCVDAGWSTGTIDEMQDGRLRLIEVFQWFTRPGRGTNVFEQIRDTGEAI